MARYAICKPRRFAPSYGKETQAIRWKQLRHGTCRFKVMNTRLLTTALCLAGSFSIGLVCASAEFEVSAGIQIQSASDFYQPLAANGAWVQAGRFGHCWHPAVTAEWRPYCNGSWEWTDCGWYWASDEPWAWACYHYGSWVLDPTYGWVWIPDIEWAPAWVVWRTSDDYTGWAPCGPSGVTIDASYYVFVQNGHFNEQIRPNRLVVNNPGLVSQTREIRSSGREQRQLNGRMQTVVVNNGPDLALVEKATGHKFSQVSIQKADQSTYRSAPKQLKNQKPVQPKELQTPDGSPNAPGRQIIQETPDSRTIRQNPQAQPHNLPNNGLLPESPNERRIPQNPDSVPHGVPNNGTLPQSPGERTIHQNPPDGTLPGGKTIIPADRQPQRPQTTIPPVQVPHQTAPTTPPPAEKRLDPDHNSNP
jgi:hypothetical protein